MLQIRCHCQICINVLFSCPKTRYLLQFSEAFCCIKHSQHGHLENTE